MSNQMMKNTCGFAFPGTYGHECGAPATKVGIMKTDRTKNGLFFAKRCEGCTKHKGGDNAFISHFEDFDQSKHINQW